MQHAHTHTHNTALSSLSHTLKIGSVCHAVCCESSWSPTSVSTIRPSICSRRFRTTFAARVIMFGEPSSGSPITCFILLRRSRAASLCCTSSSTLLLYFARTDCDSVVSDEMSVASAPIANNASSSPDRIDSSCCRRFVVRSWSTALSTTESHTLSLP